MGSNPTRNYEAVAPDGTVVALRTSGSYDYVSLAKYRDGSAWFIAAKGWSYESVLKRGSRYGGRGPFQLNEAIPPAFREYWTAFARPYVWQYFVPGEGWHILQRGEYASTRRIRQFKRDGATAVGVKNHKPTGTPSEVADFQISELLPKRGTK